MPQKIAPRNGMLFGWATGEDYWGGPMNDNLLFTDALLHPIIRSLSWAAPPTDTENGDMFVVAAGATDEWEGQQGMLAVKIENAWKFYKPRAGWRARLTATNKFVWYDGTQWLNEDDGSTAEDPTPGVTPKEYHISVTIPYAPDSKELLLLLPIIRPMMLAKGAVGSVFTMMNASPGYRAIDVQRNGISVGKIIIQAAQYDATFSIPNAVTFGAGDRISLIAPEGRMDEFKNFGMVLKLDFLGD